MSFLRYNLFFLFLCCFSTVGFTQANKRTNNDIHFVCQNDYAFCLDILPSYLVSSVPESRLWYTYKLYQLESLFALERYAKLQQALESVVHKENLPTKFKIHVLILYAKLIKYQGQEELAVQYLNEAKDILLAVNKEWPKPIELIQVANLMNSLEQYQIGYEMLLGVEKKFQGYNEPIFRYQLYTNLGHFALYTGDHEQHIVYRKKTLQWTEKGSNLNHQTIGLFNLARAYFFVERDQESLVYFKKTIPAAKRAKNSSIEDKCYINMADIYFRQQAFEQVQQMIDKVEFSKLEGSYQARYLALVEKLAKKKPGVKPGKK